MLRSLSFIFLFTTAGLFAGQAPQSIKVEIVPPGLFKAHQTLSIPIAENGDEMTSSVGTTRTFFSCDAETHEAGNTVRHYTANNEFFGVTVTAAQRNGVTSIKVTYRTLLGVNLSPDGLSSAPEVSEQRFETAFKAEAGKPVTLCSLPNGPVFKRITCTLL